ncbi:MAG: SOS response-associated peptidase family protein [Sphingobium sp.]|nr:SOS response-associated peptidase family protein [Sphingobium sp.]
MRYCLDASAEQIAQRFGADAGRDPWAGGDVTPGGYAPVIVRGNDRIRRIMPRQWGVPPPPKAALLGGAPVLMVRNLDSPFWIGTLRHREFRCLVPVTAFRAGSRSKDPVTGRPAQHWFTLPASSLFAFAGIWRDSEVPSFAILSCEANRLASANGAEAMPVILHAEDHEHWLGADWKQAQKLAAPLPSQLMAHALR